MNANSLYFKVKLAWSCQSQDFCLKIWQLVNAILNLNNNAQAKSFWVKNIQVIVTYLSFIWFVKIHLFIKMQIHKKSKQRTPRCELHLRVLHWRCWRGGLCRFRGFHFILHLLFHLLCPVDWLLLFFHDASPSPFFLLSLAKRFQEICILVLIIFWS